MRRNTHASYGMASVGANTGEGWLHVHGRRGWGIPTLGSVNQRTQTKENYTSSTIPTNLDQISGPWMRSIQPRENASMISPRSNRVNHQPPFPTPDPDPNPNLSSPSLPSPPIPFSAPLNLPHLRFPPRFLLPSRSPQSPSPSLQPPIPLLSLCLSRSPSNPHQFNNFEHNLATRPAHPLPSPQLVRARNSCEV